MLASILICFRQSRFTYILAAIFVFLFAAHNYFRIPYSDWAWYGRHFVFIYENGLQPYLALSDRPHSALQTLRSVRPAATEPVIYIYMYLIGNIAGSNVALFGAITAAIFYALVSTASIVVSRALKLSNVATITVLIFAVTIVPNYALVLHLLRQEIAAALIMMSIAAYISGRSRWAITLSALAIMTHNSAVIPIAAFATAGVLLRYTGSALVHIPFYMTAGLAFILVATNTGRVDLIKDDGAVGLLTYALDGTILAAYASCLLKLQFEGGRVSAAHLFTMYATIFYIILLVFASQIDLLFLRLYFYSDIFVLFVFAMTILMLDSRRLITAYAPYAVLALGVTYILLILARSPLPFGMPLHQVALWPFA